MTAVLDPLAPKVQALRARVADLGPWDRSRALWLLQTAYHPNPDARRPNQLTPPGNWNVALWLAGRNFGKTRIGAEDVSDYCRRHPGCRYAGIAATYEDGRGVMVEGNSGVLSCVPPGVVKSWNRSLGELLFTNGSRFDIYTGEKPDSLRGPQHDRAWVDEPAKFRYLTDTWDNLIFGLRLGDLPQCLVTGTPKPIGLIRDLLTREHDDVFVTRGTSYDNRRNVAPHILAYWERRYPPGSLQHEQEMLGRLLDDYPGALWTRKMILDSRWTGTLPPLREVTIGVDPSGFTPEFLENEDLGAIAGHGRETGVVVVGIDYADPPHVYVLEDLSGAKTGEEWGADVVEAYYRWANRGIPTMVVPETNMAAPLVLSTVRLSDPNGQVRFFRQPSGRLGVHAADKKRARAEMPAMLYTLGRAHHAGSFPALEDAMVTWDPNENWSPDRMDALVWAITALNPTEIAAPSGDSYDAFEEALTLGSRY